MPKQQQQHNNRNMGVTDARLSVYVCALCKSRGYHGASRSTKQVASPLLMNGEFPPSVTFDTPGRHVILHATGYNECWSGTELV